MKTVRQSTVTVVQQMTQQDANLAGHVHGGTVMKLIDNTASIAAVRHTGTNCVTVSIDRLDFHSPVFVGDLLRIISSINMVGRTSMEVGVRVEAENFITGEVRHTATAYLTFVALDANGAPAAIAPIAFESEDELRRNREAMARRQSRLECVQKSV